MTIASILSRFPGAKKEGDAWKARCPVPSHGQGKGDRNPSLSIKEGDDQRILLHCHTGCSTDSICSALKITKKDLFAVNGSGPQTVKPRVVATYDYTDQNGKMLFQVVRYDPKDFRQRKPDKTALDGWTWSTRGVRRVPYHLPKLIEAVKAERPVWIVEGEKDVETMQKAGFAATCNAGGSGKWEEAFNEYFVGAQVVVVADKDVPGRKHAQQIAANLKGVAASVKVVECPGKGKDASDYFKAGGQAVELDELAQNAPEWSEENQPKQGFEIVDAAVFLAEPLPQPTELIAGLLHQGSKLVFGGGSKSCKTWALLDLALSVAHGRNWLGFDTNAGRVLFLNFEIQAWSWQRRLDAVAKAKGIAIEPGRLSLCNLRGKAANFALLLPQIRDAAKQDFALIVLDPIYKLYGGTDENKAGDVAALLNGIEELAVTTGAAVAFGAHFSKGNQAGKESIDRISGSGVFSRDPDSLLIFTKHEEQDAFSIEPTLRNFAPVEPFAVRWQYPLMVPDADLDPSRLKQPKTGAPRKYTIEKLCAAILDAGSVSISEWARLAGIKRQTFTDTYLPEIRASNLCRTVGEGSQAKQILSEKGQEIARRAHAGN